MGGNARIDHKLFRIVRPTQAVEITYQTKLGCVRGPLCAGPRLPQRRLQQLVVNTIDSPLLGLSQRPRKPLAAAPGLAGSRCLCRFPSNPLDGTGAYANGPGGLQDAVPVRQSRPDSGFHVSGRAWPSGGFSRSRALFLSSLLAVNRVSYPTRERGVRVEPVRLHGVPGRDQLRLDDLAMLKGQVDYRLNEERGRTVFGNRPCQRIAPLAVPVQRQGGAPRC